MTDPICQRCGQSLWLHAEMDYTGETDIAVCEEFMKIQTNSISFWWCDHCKEEVDGTRVTFQEHHDTCGYIVRCLTQPDATTAREARLVEALEQLPREVPTNWCDPLLTGNNAVIKTADSREVEALLLGIQNRLRDFVATALAEHRGEQ